MIPRERKCLIKGEWKCFINAVKGMGGNCRYGVATISRLRKIICLFCKRALEKRLYSAKETYHFKEPTNRSHLIGGCVLFRGRGS